MALSFSERSYRERYRKHYRVRNRSLYPDGARSMVSHHRVCKVCGVRKPHIEFAWFWAEANPLSYRCKRCLNVRTLINKYDRLRRLKRGVK